MKTVRAIGIGVLIWILGVSTYVLSFYLPIMDDRDQQANAVLFAVVIPLVWTGAGLYYKNGHAVHGWQLGQILFLTSVTLDALITVPFLIIPNGGSYYAFFTDLGFWLIALEFMVVAALYWYIKVSMKFNKQ
ncbi:DUF5367 family protein [Flagellimonas pacifica]|uniref:Uncharacterized protein n=1 Tax=Flagellimonas pacifica TaxID=1247520 RepID=A0A285M5B3_9FLAO|nr:DUF5367 family protein [Allomuricauda parva]SNY92354.1 hypothetical protein SAMN06265377_0034 [Allomuricauda parva]